MTKQQRMEIHEVLRVYYALRAKKTISVPTTNRIFKLEKLLMDDR